MLFHRLFALLTSLGVPGLFAAPKQSRGAWLAGVMVESYAPALYAEHTRHRVPERGLSPCAGEREFWRVYGLGPSSLLRAPVCCACGDTTLRESWGSCGDFGQPCAGRDWPDFGHAACL